MQPLELALRQTIKALLFTLVLAVLLLTSSGNAGWTMAWVYIGIYAACAVINSLIMTFHNQELVLERLHPAQDSKTWDRWIAPLMAGFCPALIAIVAGLDVRFGWSKPVSPIWQVAATAVAILGYALLTWAMLANPFFSAVVRIQTERGHTVTTGGPYCCVRHPGYVGMLTCALATPLMLGALWAFIPALAALLIGLVRTAREDRTLQHELAGYSAYARRVRYRLLPGVW